MFNRTLIVALFILLAVPIAESRRKKSKSGKITDGVYHDATYGFQITLPGNWKPDIHKATTFYRLTLFEQTVVEEMKKVNPEFIEQLGGNLWSITPAEPLIELWVVPTTCSPRDVLDTLLSDETKSVWKERLLRTTHHPEETMQYQGVKGGSFCRTKTGPLKGTRWTGTFGHVAPSLNWLETELNVSLVSQALDNETVLVLVMRAEKEWLDLTIDTSNEMLVSLKIKPDEE